jgi:hypothetical protein
MGELAAGAALTTPKNHDSDHNVGQKSLECRANPYCTSVYNYYLIVTVIIVPPN